MGLLMARLPPSVCINQTEMLCCYLLTALINPVQRIDKILSYECHQDCVCASSHMRAYTRSCLCVRTCVSVHACVVVYINVRVRVGIYTPYLPCQVVSQEH
jgi:hypothetical protein